MSIVEYRKLCETRSDYGSATVQKKIILGMRDGRRERKGEGEEAAEGEIRFHWQT